MYDVIVIGAGPGGYPAAIQCAKNKLKTVCISPELGGTCLQRGCIPSKFLLSKSTKIMNTTTQHDVQLADLTQQKNDVVKKLSSGIEHMFRTSGVEWIKQSVVKVDRNSVVLDDGRVLSGKYIIIATGSEPITLHASDNTSDHALDWTALPSKLLVVGSGYIGLELATVYKRLGSEVTVIDVSDKFLPFLDDDVSKYVKDTLPFPVRSGVKLDACTMTDHTLTAQLSDNSTIDVNAVLYAIGRKSVLPTVAIEIQTERGLVKVDDYMRTSVSNIYAIGDITHGPMLAHKASQQGLVAAAHIANLERAKDKNVPNLQLNPFIPSVIYLEPEVATIGKCEKDLEPKSYLVFKKSYQTNGRALVEDATLGFVKIIVGKNDGLILGASIIGERAESLITQIAIGMNFGATVNDFATICYPHPSFDEIVSELMYEASVWCHV